MKTLLFLFIFSVSLAYGQSPVEQSLIGSWTSCGNFELTIVKELSFTKGNRTDCAEDNGSCTIWTFTKEKANNPFVQGNGTCNGQPQPAGTGTNPERTWSVSQDGKKLLLSYPNGKDTQLTFSIVSINEKQLRLKKK